MARVVSEVIYYTSTFCVVIARRTTDTRLELLRLLIALIMSFAYYLETRLLISARDYLRLRIYPVVGEIARDV